MEPPDVDDADGRTIRPAAIISDGATRAILRQMADNSVLTGGLWLPGPSRWVRYDQPWAVPREQGRTTRLGTVMVALGVPKRGEVTIYQVSLTRSGAEAGLTPEELIDEALAFGDLSLAGCPRAGAGEGLFGP